MQLSSCPSLYWDSWRLVGRPWRYQQETRRI